MARQKLIHFHTSGTTETKTVLTSGENALSLGEIAVQHNVNAAKIYVRLSDAQGDASANVAEFIDSAAVDAKITAAVTGATGDIANLQSIVGNGISGKSLTQAITEANSAIAAEADRAVSAETALGGRIDDVVGDLADEASARTAADDAINAKIGGNFDSTDTVASAISGLETNIGNVNTALGTESSARTADVADINARIGTGFTSADTITKRVEDLEAAVGIDGGEDSISDRVSNLEDGLANEITARTAADTELENSITANTSEINNLKTALGNGFGTTSATEQLAAVKTTADSALQSISKGTDGDYVTTTVGTKANNDQSVGVAVTVVAVSAATGTTKGLAEASDVKAYADGLDSAMDTRVDQLESDSEKLLARTSGFSDTEGSIKDYIDSAVTTSIASVYKVKGSVADYASLPSSNVVEGDVYNVVASATVDGKVYPAGTNWVWVAATTGENPVAAHWDPLGGTVDLSPYMMTSAFTSWTADTYAIDKQAAETNLNNEVKARTADTAELKAIIGNYTTAATVQAAIEAISSADTANHDLITAETENRTTADTAIMNLIGTGFDSGSTATTVAGKVQAAQSKADQNGDDITAINGKLGEGFTTASTVADQLGAVKTTADGAVQSVSVKNTATNLITATEDGTTHNVELDFDNMVIDCGSYA